MTFETALRLSELLLAWAILLQSLEHLTGSRSERLIFGLRLPFAGLLMAGILPAVALAGLFALALAQLHRFQGPYNGGADKMTVLVLTCLGLAHVLPGQVAPHMAMAYLAVQLVLSYFVSGWVKLRNPIWRSGEALRDVFLFSAYPVSAGLRVWATRPRAMLAASWAVICFEVAFPLTLLHPQALLGGLFVAALFHASNACCFGLNRFFWIWISAFPSLIWFQERLLDRSRSG